MADVVNTWFSSDIHFGHTNIIKFTNRPYNDAHHMNTSIISIWNSTVDENDIVYFLGDFSLNGNVACNIVKYLNGSIHLISGNHDKTFAKHNSTKHLKWVDMYLEAGFKSVESGLSIDIEGELTLLSHFPYLTPGFDQRYKDYRLTNMGQWLLHGHEHGRYKKNGRMIDCGLDVWGRPVSLDEIVELKNSTIDYIPGPLTDWYKIRDIINDPT